MNRLSSLSSELCRRRLNEKRLAKARVCARYAAIVLSETLGGMACPIPRALQLRDAKDLLQAALRQVRKAERG